VWNVLFHVVGDDALIVPKAFSCEEKVSAKLTDEVEVSRSQSIIVSCARAARAHPFSLARERMQRVRY